MAMTPRPMMNGPMAAPPASPVGSFVRARAGPSQAQVKADGEAKTQASNAALKGKVESTAAGVDALVQAKILEQVNELRGDIQAASDAIGKLIVEKNTAELEAVRNGLEAVGTVIEAIMPAIVKTFADLDTWFTNNADHQKAQLDGLRGEMQAMRVENVAGLKMICDMLAMPVEPVRDKSGKIVAAKRKGM